MHTERVVNRGRVCILRLWLHNRLAIDQEQAVRFRSSADIYVLCPIVDSDKRQLCPSTTAGRARRRVRAAQAASVWTRPHSASAATCLTSLSEKRPRTFADPVRALKIAAKK